MGANNTAANNAVGLGIKQELSKSFIAAIGNRTAAGRPRKEAFLIGNTLCLALLFGKPCPSHFWIGIGNRWNLLGIKKGFLTRRRLSSNMAFVHCFVSQHGLTDNIPNSKNVRDIRAHLLICCNKAALIYRNTGITCFNLLTIR